MQLGPISGTRAKQRATCKWPAGTGVPVGTAFFFFFIHLNTSVYTVYKRRSRRRRRRRRRRDQIAVAINPSEMGEALRDVKWSSGYKRNGPHRSITFLLK